MVRGQKRHLAQRLRLPPHHVLLWELPPALLLPGRLQDDHGEGAEALHALPVQVREAYLFIDLKLRDHVYAHGVTLSLQDHASFSSRRQTDS